MAARHYPDATTRFWSKVDKRGPDECWPWTGSRRGGYGLFWDGRHRQAHVVSWEIENQRPMPDGHDGLHACDNPPCVNPAHISPGTHADNMRDAAAKGRWRVEVCKHGHEMTIANTHVAPNGKRVCRACKRETMAAIRARRRMCLT